MNSFWNKGEKEIIKGLDILGLRGIDQHIETQLLASITTISIRARYLSLLPWMVGEFFNQLKNETTLDTNDMRQLLMQVFDRLDLVIILSTAHEKSKDSKVLDTGIIGKEVHAGIVAEFYKNDYIDMTFLKDKAKSLDYTNPSFGTYYNPCRGFGLLGYAPNIPVSLPPRGKAVYEARKSFVKREGGLLQWLLDGGKLTQQMIAEESQLFSISHIESVPEEIKLLRESFLVSFDEINPEVKESYDLFKGTFQWILQKLDTSKKPYELIHENYDYCISKTADELNKIEIKWFEFELRRRVHFGLELLLKALSFTLDELNGATVEIVVENWLIDINDSNNYPDGLKHYKSTLKDYNHHLKSDIYFNDRPEAPYEQALYAISLIEICRLQTMTLIDSISKVENDVDYMRKTFLILENMYINKLYEALIEVIKFCVVEPHLKTTLRKMGQNQQCSLRFFPEGQKLIPTGIDTNAGISGSRLDNAIRMISDIRICDSVDGGKFIKNMMSETILKSLEVSA